MRSEWSTDHRRAVEELEERLGREICGVPTEDGDPCSQWPVSATHGRCRQHAETTEGGADGYSIFGESSSEGGEAPDPASEQGGGRTRSAGFWVALAMTGIVLGAGIVGGLLYYDVIWIPRSMAMPSATSSPANPDPGEDGKEEEVTVDVDPRNPDFTRIRSLYRQGEVDSVAVALKDLVEKAPDRTDRARAMYFQFVLYQNQGAYDEALQVADRFLETFEGHERRPEVLFGAGFLCKRHLDRPDRARQYFRRLENQYPESAWARRLSSLS